MLFFIFDDNFDVFLENKIINNYICFKYLISQFSVDEFEIKFKIIRGQLFVFCNSIKRSMDDNYLKLDILAREYLTKFLFSPSNMKWNP